MRGAQLCAAMLCGVLCCAAPSVGFGEDAADNDPSVLRIDAGRLGALLDRASEATGHLGRKSSSADDADTPLSVDMTTKEVAVQLLLFRNMLVERHLPGRDRAIQWPEWIFEPPTASHSKETLRSRIDWLSEEVVAITDPVCGVAAKKTGDYLICSVE